MVREWELDKESLGLLQTGPTMTVENAVSVTCIGKNNLISKGCRMGRSGKEHFDQHQEIRFSLQNHKFGTENSVSLNPNIELAMLLIPSCSSLL